MLIAVEGTHCTGKSTFATALAAALLDLGWRVGLVGEVVRENLAIVDHVRSATTFTLESQIQLAAHHLHAEATSAVGHEIVVTDRSVLNVLGYLDAQDMTGHDPDAADLAHTFRAFVTHATRRYQAIFFLHDHFPIDRSDPLRSGTHRWQTQVHTGLEAALGGARCPVHHVPTGLTTTDRVAFAITTLREKGHLIP